MVFMLLMARLVNGYLVIMGIMASPVFRPLLGKKICESFYLENQWMGG